MSKRIILFNIFYYACTIGLIKLGQYYPSSSLGYGYFTIIFWVIAAILLVFFWMKKIIYPKTLFEKIGVLTATPLVSLIAILISLSFNETVSSEWIFNKQGKQYKVITLDNRSNGGKRIEYYSSINDSTKEDIWVRDSTWVYLSKTGDTIKTIKYNSKVEMK